MSPSRVFFYLCLPLLIPAFCWIVIPFAQIPEEAVVVEYDDAGVEGHWWVGKASKARIFSASPAFAEVPDAVTETINGQEYAWQRGDIVQVLDSIFYYMWDGEKFVPLSGYTPTPQYLYGSGIATVTPRSATEMIIHVEEPTPAQTATPMTFHSPTPMNTPTPMRTPTPMNTPTPPTITPAATATPMNTPTPNTVPGKKYSEVIGDGVNQCYEVHHNFNERDVIVWVEEVGGSLREMEFDIQRTDINYITICANMVLAVSGARVVVTVPGNTLEPDATYIPTPMNTPTPMRTPTPPPVYHSPTPAQTATPQATPTEMQTPTPANTATPMIFHSPTPANTATPAKTATPMRTPTPMSTATPMATATPMEAVGNVENIWNSTDVIQILGDIWNIVNEQKFYTHVNVELVDIHGDHSRYMFPGLIFNNQVQVSVSDGTSAAAIRIRWLHYVIEDNGHVIRFTPPLADRDPYTGRTVNPHAFATWIRRIP